MIGKVAKNEYGEIGVIGFQRREHIWCEKTLMAWPKEFIYNGCTFNGKKWTSRVPIIVAESIDDYLITYINELPFMAPELLESKV